MPNRLIDETSPYLLQHAHNPVDWYPWGDESLQAARDGSKPILLSIGYSACHWCHVMERESFENPLVAARMNSLFINIKVDREERPDLDELYMRAVQAFNQGRGGWPMTVFLTPHGQPFFGGTYFPPVARGEVPSFTDLLTRMSDLWRRSRGDVERITGEVQKLLDRTGALPQPESALATDWLDVVAESARGAFDGSHAGFGDTPKFPPHGVLPCLLAHFRRTADEASLAMVTRTLDAMARGALYDLLGGGFARYSVDAQWRVPHFEKMLHDTAQLVPVYLDAWKITHDAHYARIVRESLSWATREMWLDNGGFAASLDADSEGAEGTFYAWTPAQIAEVIGEGAEQVAALLQVTAIGTFERGSSVLRSQNPLERLTPEDRALLERALPLLYAARETRARPDRDDKVVTSWNAQLISAFARAAAAFEDPDLAATARRAARFLLDEVTVNGRLMRTYKDGRAHIPAYADDHAALVTALLDLYTCDLDPSWLDAANDLADTLVRLFWDDADGGLFYGGSDQPALVQRSKHPLGGAEPSANELAAHAFVRLSRLCGRDDLARRADQILRSLQVQLRQSPRAMGIGALAGAWAAGAGQEVAVIGDRRDPRTAALLAVARSAYLPFAVLAAAEPGSEPSRMAWLHDKTLSDDTPTAFVCEGFSCKLPTSDPDGLAMQLDDIATHELPTAPPAEARVPAPELPTDPAAWLGRGGPTSLAELRGQVVVLHFWTHGHLPSLYALRALSSIDAAYATRPVEIIHAHAAKFDGERPVEAVQRAMARLQVVHRVVHDPDHALWTPYGVRTWPTLVVIDTHGRVAWQQAGPLDSEALTAAIDGALAEGDAGEPRVRFDPVASDADTPLRYPASVHLWPDAQDQELGADPWKAAHLYISDTGHHRVLECQVHRDDNGWPKLGPVRAFGNGQADFVDGPADRASFRSPRGTVRHGERLYVADTDNHALRAVDLTTGRVSTLAGTGRLASGPPDRRQLATPLELDLRSPWDVDVMALRGEVLVFISMAGHHQVWVYAGGHLGLFAGSGIEDHIDGPAAGAAMAQPAGMAMFGRYLLLADSAVSSIRGVDLQSHQVVTVVGRGPFDFGDIDGTGDDVRLQQPLALTFADDRLYVADTLNHKIKSVSLSTLEATTIVGGDSNVLCEPNGITRIGDHLIVADTHNHRLRVVQRHTGEIRTLHLPAS